MNAASNATSRSLGYAIIIIEKMEKAIALSCEQYDWNAFTKYFARKHC